MKILVIFLTLSLLFFHCGEQAPTVPEGKALLKVVVIDHLNQPVAEAKVFCQSIHGFKTAIQVTDSSGETIFQGLPSSEYLIKAFKRKNGNVRRGSISINLVTGEEKSCQVTIYPTSYGLKINEIYYAGTSDNNVPYYGDQFVELYNSSDSIIYLDGMMLFYGAANELSGKDNDGDGDLDFWTIAPGSSRNKLGIANIFRFDGDPNHPMLYPLEPGAYIVIAKNAKNHKLDHPSSVDLSRADFEFFSARDPNDEDNPLVPNVMSIIKPEDCGAQQADFNIGLKRDFLILANGRDPEYCDGIEISTIIDGVEYIDDKNILQRLDDRIDRGAAGISGDEIISRYSGKSIQRIEPGYDTDNSTEDFVIIKPPTPGR